MIDQAADYLAAREHLDATYREQEAAKNNHSRAEIRFITATTILEKMVGKNIPDKIIHIPKDRVILIHWIGLEQITVKVLPLS